VAVLFRLEKNEFRLVEEARSCCSTGAVGAAEASGAFRGVSGAAIGGSRRCALGCRPVERRSGFGYGRFVA
jgi:hypothetical protein